jgi:ubiquinone/menaquinone biosynthesis C-methylase UbiE
MIDRSLNYGRHIVESFLAAALPYRAVLDLGAGPGQDLMIARKISSEASLNAIECNPEYVRRLSEMDTRVCPLNIEKDHFPFDDESVDIVIMNQVLEHTKEIFWIFHETSRILRRGGKIILGVPNLSSLHNRILLFFGRQPTSIKTGSAHIRGFTKRDILQFLDDCFPQGYMLKAFGGSNFYPFPPCIARPLASVFPTMAWGIFFMFEKQREYGKEFLEFPPAQKLETNYYLGDE